MRLVDVFRAPVFVIRHCSVESLCFLFFNIRRILSLAAVLILIAVNFPQFWPHSALQFECVSDSVSFMSLEPTTFVAGELETIMSRRIEFQKKLAGLNC